jgi:hypothetical protein
MRSSRRKRMSPFALGIEPAARPRKLKCGKRSGSEGNTEAGYRGKPDPHGRENEKRYEVEMNSCGERQKESEYGKAETRMI